MNEAFPTDNGVLARRPSPQQQAARGLVLLWCLWLLGSWISCLLLDAYIPATRLMLFASMVGMMTFWPAFRLSQERDGHAAASQVLWDWLCLNLVFQTVLWMIHGGARWNLFQALWVDAAVAGWSLLTGVVIAIGLQRSRAWARAAAMAVCVAMMLGEPLLIGVLGLMSTGDGPPAWPIVVSPLGAIANMTAPKPQIPHWHVLIVAAAAIGGWVATWLRRPD